MGNWTCQESRTFSSGLNRSGFKHKSIFHVITCDVVPFPDVHAILHLCRWSKNSQRFLQFVHFHQLIRLIIRNGYVAMLVLRSYRNIILLPQKPDTFEQRGAFQLNLLDVPAILSDYWQINCDRLFAVLYCASCERERNVYIYPFIKKMRVDEDNWPWRSFTARTR